MPKKRSISALWDFVDEVLPETSAIVPYGQRDDDWKRRKLRDSVRSVLDFAAGKDKATDADRRSLLPDVLSKRPEVRQEVLPNCERSSTADAGREERLASKQ